VPDDRVERKLTTILAADVAGYSRLMNADEEGTLARLKAHRRELIDPRIAEHRGRIIKTTGDGLLLEFPSVVDAVRCANDVQNTMHERNLDVPIERRIEFRVGINIGDVIIEGDDIYGDGVNVAARLEALATPGSIWVSQAVRDQVIDKLNAQFADMGEHLLKNIPRPLRVYRISVGTSSLELSPTLTMPDKPSIAVLPFVNMSGDPEQGFFADGVTEDLITQLSHIHELFVIARNSTFTYKGKAVDVRQVARELGVRYVLEGSVRKGGDRIRVTAQLIEADTGRHVWADKFDGAVADIFDLQDDVTAKIIAALQLRVTIHEGVLSERRQRQKLDVWDCLTRSRMLITHFTKESTDLALALAEQAIALDPGNAKAYQAKAFALVHETYFDAAAAPALYAEALALAEKSLSMDARDEWTHWTYAISCLLTDPERCVMSCRRALEINPNFALAYGSLCSALTYLGEPKEGIEAANKSLRLDPQNPAAFFRYGEIAFACLVLRDYESCILWATKAVQIKQDSAMGLLYLACGNARLGRRPEATKALTSYRKIMPGASVAHFTSRPFRRPEDRDHFMETLRLAGLPEGV
jgi:adenylate cyclase